MASLITPCDLPRPQRQGLIGDIESEAMTHLHNIQVVSSKDPAHPMHEQQLYDQLNQFAGKYVDLIDEHLDSLEERRQNMQSSQEEEQEDLPPPPPSEMYTINYEPLKFALLRLEMDSGKASDYVAQMFCGGFLDDMMRIMQGVLFAIEIEMERLRQATEAYEQQHQHRFPEIFAPRPVAAPQRFTHLGDSSASTSFSTWSMERTGSRKRGHDHRDAFTSFEEFPTDRPAKRPQPVSQPLRVISEDGAEEK